MGNGIIEINEKEINDIANHLKKSSNNVQESTSRMSTSFKSFTKVGLFSKGSNKLSKQMNAISSGISKMGDAVLKQYDNMNQTENALKAKAENIDIPQDFVVNDASRAIDMKSDKLTKEDGKKVDSTDNTKQEELIFDSTISYNEKLKDIVKEYESINGKIIINGINGTKNKLGKIKNGKVISVVNVSGESVIKKEELENINHELKNMIQDIDLDLDINKINLKSLNLEMFKDSSLDDYYAINKKNLYQMRSS